MLLSNTTETIQISKGAATTTTSPEVFASYVDVTTTTFTPGVERTVLSGGSGTDTTVVSAPAASTTRQVKYMTVFNRDTVTHTFTVQHDLSGTDFFVAQLVLLSDEMAEFVWERGWVIHDSSGFCKQNIGIGVSAVVAGTSTATSGQVSFADSNGVSFGMNAQTMTLRAVPNLNSSYWAGAYAQGTVFTAQGTVNGSLWVSPLNPDGDLRFPGIMTVSSMYMAMSGSQTATTTSSTSAAFTWSFGLYTLNGSTLSLLNSGTATASIGSGSDCTSGLHGPRFLDIATSGWSAPIVLTNAAYFLGILQTSAGTSKSISFLGWRFQNSNQWSGFLGQATSSATSRGMYPFAGLLATAGIPTAIQQSQLNKANASAGFIPYIVFNNFSNLL